MKKKIVLVSIVCILLCGFTFGCGKDKADVSKNHILSYTISYLDSEGTKDKAELLGEKVKDIYQGDMTIEADKLHVEENLIYIGGEGLSAQTGTLTAFSS